CHDHLVAWLVRLGLSGSMVPDPLLVVDSDRDGLPNGTDPDDDNDGQPDATDCAPLDASLQLWLADGTTCVVDDTDDDNDGELDLTDCAPRNPLTQVLLVDGTTCVANDTDDDNDGEPDATDCAPRDPLKQALDLNGNCVLKPKPTWTALAAPTRLHSGPAVLLADGRIAVLGGVGPAGTAVPWLDFYDPAQDRWSAGPDLSKPRQFLLAVTLANGRILACGPDVTCELYDPTANRWSVAASMSQARSDWEAAGVVLTSGKVLVVGDQNGTATTGEVYDPALDTWTSTGTLAVARHHDQDAVRLADGRVLVAGGWAGNGFATVAQIYDPTTNAWTATGTTTASHIGGRLIQLSSGKVLLIGHAGIWGPASGAVEIYDPATNTWTVTGSLLTPRGYVAAAEFPSGHVVAAIGTGPAVGVTAAEIRDPVTGTWSSVAALSARAELGRLFRLDARTAVLVSRSYEASGLRVTRLSLY
ncbi:MAG: hypothetical protein IT371_28075, partial [Deltaproteobacteria bacterium]|nr:hypothetical protein [Deltaproteobacteria bacterium]